MRPTPAALLLAVLAGACTPALGTMERDQPGIQLQQKVIARKDEPNLLVAHDGSTCLTSASRWQKAKVGRPFLCDWKSTG